MVETAKKALAFVAAGTMALTMFMPLSNVQAQGNSNETESNEITQFMDCYMPMPIVGELTTECWGTEMVGARDQSNGLEDTDLSDYSYWDGTILKNEENGKYYMFASRWYQAGGHWGENGVSGWQGSQAVYAVSDNLYGPYVDQGPIWPDWCDGAGHNVFAFEMSESDPLYEEGYRYAISISDTGMHGDVANGTIHVARSLDGPWELIDNGNNGKLNAQGGSGFSLSNVSIMVRPDGKYEATNRNGDLAIADSLAGVWEVQSNGLWWNVEGMPNTNVEDPVIWYSDGLYHIVANKWDAKEAYYLTSEDGLTGWVRHSGIAYTPKENFLKYEDGTENNWTKLERPGIYVEDGKLVAMTFAVIDVEKEQDHGNDGHGSKIIVVPFDGAALADFAHNDVYVDPMANRPGLTPTDDTTAQSWDQEAYKNWGGEYFIQVQRNNSQGLFGEGAKPDNGYDCKIAYIKYDISDYLGKEVESATLSLVSQGRQAGTSNENQIEVALAKSDWKEGIGKEYDPGGNGNIVQDSEDVVWDNQPEILYADSSVEDTVTAMSDVFDTVSSPILVNVDVTELVKMYMAEYPDATEITFALSETKGDRLRIGSKEGGDATVAKLDITASEDSEEPVETVSKNLLEYFLNSAKEHVANGDVDDCVESIRNLFDEAIAEGDAVMADKNATKDDVVNAAAKLMYAIHALDMKAADKTDLEMAVELANIIDLTKYVDEGQENFKEVLEKAQAVLDDGDVMQPEADTAWSALVEAMKSLRMKADKSTLEDLINRAEGLDLTQYTNDSVEEFNSVLMYVQKVYNDETLSVDDQQLVDDAVIMLSKSIDNLVVKKDETGGIDDGNSTDDDYTVTDKSNSDNGSTVPQTGDTAPVAGMAAAVVLSAAVVVLVGIKRRTK